MSIRDVVTSKIMPSTKVQNHQKETDLGAAECLPWAIAIIGHVAMKTQAMASQVVTLTGQKATTTNMRPNMQQTISQVGVTMGQ